MNFFNGGEEVRGVRRVRIFMTNTNPTLVYNSNTTNMTKIFDGDIPKQVSTSPSWYNVPLTGATFPATISFVVFDVASNWGGDVMGIRQIQFGLV